MPDASPIKQSYTRRSQSGFRTLPPEGLPLMPELVQVGQELIQFLV
jgi:hypothetical protein